MSSLNTRRIRKMVPLKRYLLLKGISIKWLADRLGVKANTLRRSLLYDHSFSKRDAEVIECLTEHDFIAYEDTSHTQKNRWRVKPRPDPQY